MAKIFSKKDNKVHWDDPGMFLRVEESYWDLNEFLCMRDDLDAHMRDVQWYMSVWQKLNELLDLYTKNPRTYDPSTDKEIL